MSYKGPFQELYRDRPELRLEPYAVQQEVLFQQGYVYSNGFSTAMKSLGHDAHEMLFDLDVLQQSWATEHGVPFTPDNWQTEIILAQLEALKPDIIYLQGVNPLPLSVRQDLKTLFPSIKLVVLYEGYPVGFDEVAGADVLLVGTPTIAKQFEAMGLRPYLIYHAFDVNVLNKLDADARCNSDPTYDFTFAGSSGFGYGLGHQSRYWALAELTQRTSLKLWIDEREDTPVRTPVRSQIKSKLRRSLKHGLGYLDTQTLDRLCSLNITPNKMKRAIREIADQQFDAKERLVPSTPIRKMFPERCESAVFGMDMYRILRHSKVTFNKHTDAAVDCVGNLRMFEATGVGTCLLTDTGINMADLFEADREVVTYSSTEECVEKLTYLLSHDETRREVAAAGQRRTLRDHTFLVRCQQIDEILQKML